MLRHRYGSFCKRDAALDETHFTFHFRTCRVPVHQGLCYMNEETEQFYLKPRCDKLVLQLVPGIPLSERKTTPREIIVIELEQPMNVDGYEFVEFFVTGTLNLLPFTLL